MDHVAIMRKDWNLIDKIVNGKKTIESRWYKSRYAPWDRVHAGDTIYFKDSGSLITAKATVCDVKQFADYTDKQLRTLISNYGGGICFTNGFNGAYAWTRDKKYCILIFLENPQRVQPFAIDKKGYGNACAWMCVGDIKNVTI